MSNSLVIEKLYKQVSKEKSHFNVNCLGISILLILCILAVELTILETTLKEWFKVRCVYIW